MTFQKGRKKTGGATDKSQKFGAHLEAVLNAALKDIDIGTLEGYDQAMQIKKMLSLKLVKRAVKEEDSAIFQRLFDTIADRTEGKAPQSIDHTTGGEKINFSNYTNDQLRAIAEGRTGVQSPSETSTN